MLRQRFIAGLIVSAAVAWADDPWRYIDPQTKMVMGVQWQKIRQSAAGQRFRSELSQSMPVPHIPGFDLLSSIETVLLTSTGAPISAKSKQPSILVVISGQFDLDKVRASVSKKSRRAMVQNVEIYASADQMGLALVSPETLLIGDMPSVVRAVGGGWSGPTSLTLFRARDLSIENDFFVISSVPPSAVAGQNVPVPVPLSLEQAQSLEMAIRVTDGFAFNMVMDLGSTEVAQKLKDELAKTVKLAGKDKMRLDLAGLDKYMKMNVQGQHLRVSMQLDAADLEARMRTYQAQRPRTPAPVATAPQHRPTPGGKPVIWNADPPEK